MLEFLQWVIAWIQVIPYGYGCIFNCTLTPTPVDDGLVKVFYKVLDWVAINVGKAKDK